MSDFMCFRIDSLLEFQDGQDGRSSNNFEITAPVDAQSIRIEVSVDPNGSPVSADQIRFSIARDRSLRDDWTTFRNVGHGERLEVVRGDNFYICNPGPRGRGAFNVRGYAVIGLQPAEAAPTIAAEPEPPPRPRRGGGRLGSDI